MNDPVSIQVHLDLLSSTVSRSVFHSIILRIHLSAAEAINVTVTL